MYMSTQVTSEKGREGLEREGGRERGREVSKGEGPEGDSRWLERGNWILILLINDKKCI